MPPLTPSSPTPPWCPPLPGSTRRPPSWRPARTRRHQRPPPHLLLLVAAARSRQLPPRNAFPPAVPQNAVLEGHHAGRCPQIAAPEHLQRFSYLWLDSSNCCTRAARPRCDAAAALASVPRSSPAFQWSDALHNNDDVVERNRYPRSINDTASSPSSSTAYTNAEGRVPVISGPAQHRHLPVCVAAWAQGNKVVSELCGWTLAWIGLSLPMPTGKDNDLPVDWGNTTGAGNCGGARTFLEPGRRRLRND